MHKRLFTRDKTALTPAPNAVQDGDMDEIVDQVLSEIFVHCNPNSMRHLFKQMDTDVSGTVSKHELAKALKHLKVSKKGVVEVGDEVTAPEGWTTLCSKHAMDRLDANEDGQVSMEEFVDFCFEKRLAIIRGRMTEKEHDWEKLFHSHDTDGSGELDIKEFVQCIRKSAKLSSDSIQEDELTHMFQYLDKDKGIDGSSDWECGLGQVSIEEFMAFINGGVVGVLVGAPQGESATPAEEGEGADEPIIKPKNKGRAIAFLSGGLGGVKGGLGSMKGGMKRGIGFVGTGAKKVGSEAMKMGSELTGGKVMTVYPDVFTSFSMTCANLPTMDADSESDPILVLYTKSGGGEWAEAGRTEVIWNELNPTFVTKLGVRFPMCNLVQVRFDVYDIDDDKAVEYVKDLSLETTNKCGSTHPTLVNEVVNAFTPKSGDAGSKLLLFGDACEKQNIHNATVTLNGSVRLAITGDGKATEDVAFTHEEEATWRTRAADKANKLKSGALGGTKLLGAGAGRVGKGMGKGISKMSFRRKKKGADVYAAAVEPEPEPAAAATPEPVAAPEPEQSSTAPHSNAPPGFTEVAITLPETVQKGQKIEVPCGWTTHSLKINSELPLPAGTQIQLYVPENPDPSQPLQLVSAGTHRAEE